MSAASDEATLIDLYRRAELNLEELIVKGLQSGAKGTVRYRRAVRDRVRAIIAELEKRAMPLASQFVSTSYRDGAEAVSGPLGSFGKPDEAAVALLTENLTGRLHDGHAIIGRRVDDVFRREGLRAVAEQLAATGSAQEAAKGLAETLTHEGKTAFVDRAGRSWSLANYSTMVIRTVGAEAQGQGTMNQMHRMGQDLVDVSHHPNSCDRCKVVDGKTFSLAGKDEEYPQLPLPWPVHPNCKHVLTPSAENFNRVARELGMVI